MPKTQGQNDDWIESELKNIEQNDTPIIDEDRILSVDDLFNEERLPFKLSDGKIIYFIDIKDIKPSQSKKMESLQKVLDHHLRVLANDEENEKSLKAYNRVIDEMILMILPDLPLDVLGRLNEGQKGTILQHWSRNSDLNISSKKT